MTLEKQNNGDVKALTNVSAVILAGGEGRRMGSRSKPLLLLKDKSILEITTEKIENQVDKTYINVSNALLALSRANKSGLHRGLCEESEQDIDGRYRLSNYLAKHEKTVITDDDFSLQGPLAGILSAMKSAKDDASTEYIISVPTDSPFIPINLVQTLRKSIKNHQAAFCKSQGKEHYVLALWSLQLLPDIEKYLKSGQRSVGRFLKSIPSQAIDFPVTTYDPFFNINTPDDYDEAVKMSDFI